MRAATVSLSPHEAWQPLPAGEWDESAARHLLSRLGWTATPANTAQTLQDGANATLRRYFGKLPEFPQPPLVAQLETDGPEIARKVARGDEAAKRAARRAARDQFREALAELTIQWLQHAAKPENAPAEKWLLFLQDIWVVGVEKVRNTALIYQHQDWLRRGSLTTYPLLAKAMSRSPAMVVYLDLQQSKVGAPNENFARELFELFTLGEGNYTEADIKEAARAFTGYRQQLGQFAFVRRQHDGASKQVFGRTGRFTGDDVIDLVFQQPAARTFLVREMTKFYLSDTPLPAEHIQALGNWWAEQGFSMGKLLAAFFTSRIFYAPEFRGNFIKSPLQFYLGLLQKLELAPVPLPRRSTALLRQMGQMPFNPPNVRGWVGGRNWINSATLAARRATINSVLSPLPEDLLNGDERAALRAAGNRSDYTFPPERFEQWARLPAGEAAHALLALALPHRANDEQLVGQVTAFIQQASRATRPPAALRAILATLLESPDDQLC